MPDLPELFVQLLYNRGHVHPDAIRDFVADPPPRTADPHLMLGMQRAVERLAAAASAREQVAIYGDFDVDGVTAAAVLAETFAALGIPFLTHIPARADGYGLHTAALHALAGRGVQLVVTVDCGINSCREVALAKGDGLEVIVTDHHRVDGPVPDAVAVINPRQLGCSYPFKELAAVGVALKLAQALLGRLPVVDGRSTHAVATRLLDLAALGTVGDVAPLVGENRSLLRNGLRALNSSQRPGLMALLRSAGLKPGSITAGNIGFVLAPRLNAVGRLRDGFAAYHLLTTSSSTEATLLAAELEAANQQRQRLTVEMLDRARALVLAAGEPGKVLLVAEEDFHSGIVGLVAGRLAEEFHRPAFVVERAPGESRGSARSILGFNVAEALRECHDLLTRYGGHTMAAGFTVPSDNLPALEQRLRAYAAQHLPGSLLRPEIVVDAELPLAMIDESVYDLVKKMAPFGHGNPQPLFLARRARVVNARTVGRDSKHLKLALHDGARYHSAIAFGCGGAAARLASCVDIVYTLERNDFGGRQSLECHVKDLRNAE